MRIEKGGAQAAEEIGGVRGACGSEGGARVFDEVGNIVSRERRRSWCGGENALAIPLIARDHHGLSEVERGMAGGMRDGDEMGALREIVIGEAMGFGAEDTGGQRRLGGVAEADEGFEGELWEQGRAARASGEAADERTTVGCVRQV